MNYAIEIYDTEGRRVGRYTDVPLLEAIRRRPGDADEVRGLLPEGHTDLSHGYRVRVLIDERLFCEAPVTETAPQWSETRKLILDKYVTFREIIEFTAARDPLEGNTAISRVYTNRSIDAIVKDAIQSAPGRIHYTVAHGDYPDGAEREYQKFLARKTDSNELTIGGIDTGQWAGSDRMSLTNAYAKDGDTIAGIEVDGAPWPDLRLMLIDAEETSKNAHAVARHPEVADWTTDQYNASAYKLKADAAQAALQSLIDTKGIEYIELNPHRDASGSFDDRVDAYGRYLGLVFGGGECFNAALVEQGLADVYLYQDGKYLVPELELKDFISYSGVNEDSVQSAPVALVGFDASGGVLEALTALAYAAGGYIWSLDPTLRVTFRPASQADRVWFYDSIRMGVVLGSNSRDLINAVYFDGNPITGTLEKTYWASASIDAFGFQARSLDHFGVSLEEDADKLVDGLLDDVAYPEPSGEVEFYDGFAEVNVGDLVEFRGGVLRRLDREVEGEWGNRFAGRLVTRVKEVIHRFSGSHIHTRVRFTSPLRSVADPLRFTVRSQPRETELFQFRLDAEDVGLDAGYHLD
ncbi:MAG: thermonuclease family protein [Candidatus Hydrogenedentes bacterium]|nr:thermonuclease family protein [Candidatus Hydrogenedentota bacterium]